MPSGCSCRIKEPDHYLCLKKVVLRNNTRVLLAGLPSTLKFHTLVQPNFTVISKLLSNTTHALSSSKMRPLFFCKCVIAATISRYHVLPDRPASDHFVSAAMQANMLPSIHGCGSTAGGLNITFLPSDVVQQYLLPHLTPQSLAALRSTCQSYQQVVDDAPASFVAPVVADMLPAGLLQHATSSSDVQCLFLHQPSWAAHIWFDECGCVPARMCAAQLGWLRKRCCTSEPPVACCSSPGSMSATTSATQEAGASSTSCQ